MSSFNELCKQLAIDPSKASQESLDKLIKYCQTNISQDRVFKGSMEQQFVGYRDLVKLYSDTVLPHIEEDALCHPVPAFNNKSSLEYLVKAGFDRCIEKLKPPKSDVNTLFGLMSPLHMAATHGFQNTTSVLLKLGANPVIQNKQHEMPINYVLGLPVLHDEVLPKSKQSIFINLYNLVPESIKQPSIDGTTVAHQMAVHGYVDLLSLMLTENPRLVTVADNHGKLPIHSAILNGQAAAAQMLLKGGNAERMVDFEQRNPLHYAAQYGNKEMLELCCAAVRNIESVDKNGKTPLMLAAYNGNLDAVTFLLQAGADPSKKDRSGQNALQISIENQQLSTAEHLLKLATKEPLSEHHQAMLTSMKGGERPSPLSRG